MKHTTLQSRANNQGRTQGGGFGVKTPP